MSIQGKRRKILQRSRHRLRFNNHSIRENKVDLYRNRNKEIKNVFLFASVN